jgi:outer membrane protein TolC
MPSGGPKSCLLSPFRAVCAAIVLLPLLAWSAEPLTLAEAQRIALSRSQQMAANDASASAVRRMADVAGRLPYPVLKLGVDNLPVNGPDRFSLARDFMTMRRIGVMQELPALEKRQLRAQRVAQDAIKLQAERGLLAANLRRDTALAWLERYYALALRKLLLQQLDEARLQVEAAEASYRGAKGSQADVFAARGALSMLEDRLIQADTQARNAAVMLVRWIGGDADRLPAGPPPWQTTDLDAGFTPAHLETHPMVQVADATVQAAQLDVSLARANQRADWSVEASFSQRGSAYSNMVSIGVSVPLQLDRANRQDQEVAARLSQLDEALARYEDLLRSEEAEVGVLLNDWRSGKQRVERYADSLVPLARQRTAAALAAYRGGKGELASVLAARREQLDAQVQALAAELDTARAWARLNFLSTEHDMSPADGSQP